MKGWAHISKDRKYRYILGRRWGPGDPIVWVMLNPSTATGTCDDPTIRRVIGFTGSWGYKAFFVVNLFAFRSPDPVEMMVEPDPVGPQNDRYIKAAVSGAPLIVVAWGGKRFPKRIKEVAEGPLAGMPLHCLGTTKLGQPKHPLYLANKTELQPWKYSDMVGSH